LSRSRVARLALVVLGALVAVDVAHEAFKVGGDRFIPLIDNVIYDAVIFASGLLCIARTVQLRQHRGWAVLGVGLIAFGIGDTLWDILYPDAQPRGDVTISDVFWLGWFPFAFAGLYMLIRSRIEDFDMPRWIDGIAVALIVATPGVALAVQPVVDEAHRTTLIDAVAIAYPIGDMLLLGAAVGVLALTGWRPGRTWGLFCIGMSTWVIADALFAVEVIKGTYQQGQFDWLWPVGAYLLAVAAWGPQGTIKATDPVGWKAIALPLICQVVAIATQFYGFFHHIPEAERIMTIAVLMLVVVQLVVGRPRSRPAEAGARALESQAA
jgi:hypothetical protein